MTAFSRFLAGFALPAVLAACGGRGSSPPLENSPAPGPAATPAAAESKTVDPAPPRDQEAMQAAAVEELRKELGAGFVVGGRFPFAVGSDLTPERMSRYVEGTIGKAYDAFYGQFFKVRPDCVFRVYLFANDVSFRENVKRLWDEKTISPYGWYSPAKKALIMNIGTGGGTLVHEMVHALMAFDFPDVPTWFSEGMGSLFEQCSIDAGTILGHENWRLPILKKDIAEKRILPLRKLMATSRGEFLDGESSLHYAQARYFCMHMQEEGLLTEFYKAFRDGFAADKTGIPTAEKVLGKPLEKAERETLDWVATLKWEGR